MKLPRRNEIVPVNNVVTLPVVRVERHPPDSREHLIAFGLHYVEQRLAGLNRTVAQREPQASPPESEARQGGSETLDGHRPRPSAASRTMP